MSKYLTIPQLAKILGLSRQRVHQLVREGKIPAEKVGNTYIIIEQEILDILNKDITDADKAFNRKIIKKAIGQYKETFKRLAKLWLEIS